MKNLILSFAALAFSAQFAIARDYEDVRIGDYSNATTDMSVDRANVSFLQYMKDSVYPLIKSQADTWWEGNLEAVIAGQGAEVRLAKNVSTVHVRYMGYLPPKPDGSWPWGKWPDGEKKDPMQSGRSFGIYDAQEVKAGWRADYVADASYKFYLTELEKVLKNREQTKYFYAAIYKVLINSDSSGFSHPEMWGHTKRVASDFVAVYIAEQYRRLIYKDGRYLYHKHNWDDAHLQVTIVAAFHGGQSKDRGMFFKGRYMTRPYVQKDRDTERCAYQELHYNWKDDSKVEGLFQQDFDLSDYWQFGRTCDTRSGVNITRRDFEKLGDVISDYFQDSPTIKAQIDQLYELSDTTVKTWNKNFIEEFAEAMTNDGSPVSYGEKADAYIEAMVNATMLMYDQADTITETIAK